MKKVCYLLILAMTFLSSRAQQVRHPFFSGIADSRYAPVHTGEGELKTDSIRCFQMQAEDDSILHLIYFYTFDERGNRTLVQVDHNLSGTDISGEREMMTRFIFGWDDNNRMILSQLRVPDEDYEMKTDYFYDESGVLMAEDYYWSHDYVTWDSLARREIEYYPDGKVHFETELGSRDNIREEYIYDSQGRDSLYFRCYAEENTDPQWIISSKEEYFYAEDGKWVQRISYFDGGLGLKKTLMTAWVYEDGILDLIQRHYYDSDEVEYHATQEYYDYNEEELVSEITYNTLQGDTWVTDKIEHFEYDPAQRLIRMETTDYFEVPSSKIEYTYSEAGNMLSEKHFSYDSEWKLNTADYFFWSLLPEINSINEIYREESIFPVPSDGIIYIKTDSSVPESIRLYTLQGGYRGSIIPDGGEGVIAVHIKSPGIYLLVIVREDGSISTHKVLIR